MKGFIDRIDDDRKAVVGWVEVADPTMPPRLVASLDGRSIGTASLGPARADVRANTGLANAAFVVRLEEALPETALLSGSFELHAVSSHSSTRLHLSSGGRETEKLRIVNSLRPLIPELRYGDEGIEGKLPSGNERPAHRDRLSRLPFPVGLTSPDGSAVLRPEGHLFLVGGTNKLWDRYVPPADERGQRRLEIEARRWVDLGRERNRRISSLGLVFRQIIVPEKSTVMRDLLDDIDGPTPVFVRVEELLRETPWYVSGLKPFDGWTCSEEPWQRLDAHCTPAGSLALVRVLLDSLPDLGYALGPIDLVEEEIYAGDLTRRFFGIDMWDFNLAPARDVLSHDVELVRAFDPDGGAHTNIHRVWRCRDAPIDRKVVVFGNSFFGASGATASKLSWWFSRLFREFHFRWTPQVDDEYVADVRPDYVIAQTVERFLGRVPGR